MKKSATPTVQASGLFHRMFGVWSRRGNSLPVRKLALAVLLLAAVAFGGVFAVAQAQAANGAMTGVTLTSDTPGTLTVSWEAASPTPTDYRVDWAKSDEDFQSWKVDEGHKYPAPTATTATIADLDHDTEYKIRMRARYYRGEHEDAPWGGPWAKATITVAGEPAETPTPEPAEADTTPAAGTRDSDTPETPETPDSSAPAAPSMMGTSVSPEGRVLLLWQDPSDDSITGYQVLRGPDAASLVVIEEDTGSSGTSYTDTAPPAGETHTYAVKARNASGLSDLSNTLTATVPAAEEEEEELVTAQQSEEQVLVSNLDTVTSGRQFSHQNSSNYAKFAQSFSAANNADGATAEFDFHGITVKLGGHGGETVRLAASDLVVTLNSDVNGEPGALIYTLTPPPTISAADSGTRITFTAPPGSTLSSGVTYWLKIETATASTFFDTNYIQVFFTLDDGEVQGPATENHWSIGDTYLRSPQALSWETAQRSLAMAVLGAQRPPVLVSNLGQTDDETAYVNIDKGGAQSFVAGPGLAGFGYRFQGIRVSARPNRFFTNILVPEVSASLHSDASGLPGSRLHTLTVPDDFVSTGGFSDYTLSAPPGTVLPGGARYWVVFEVTSVYDLILSTTSATAEDQTPPPVSGWLIDNQRYEYDSEVGAPVWAIAGRPIKLAVLGEPERVTDEPAGEDFPGADFNAHETRGVVTVGTASSGDMTAGLDRDHGQTGDYWYLDTQPGHSYRVEVTFGASTGISTGGSAGIAFLDPDGVDYASSCCESDHNREDSYTFVHFTHSRQSREWNRSYMVKVAAFDLYNEGTAVYNGPYLITLTDITGVQQMVHSFSGGTTHPATDLLESGEDTGDIAVSFRTGPHSDGYTLDRIKVLFNHIPAGGATQIVALHPDVSGSPGNTEECYLRTSLIAESAVAWSYTPPHTFLATFCASVTLTANTTYWIVFPMTNRNDEVVALATDPDVKDYGSGWNVVGSGRRTTSTWVVQTDSQGRIGLWAEEN